MTRDHILWYSRRVGFSFKSFGLEPYLRKDSLAGQLTFKKAIQMTLNPTASDLALASQTATTTLGPRIYWNFQTRRLKTLHLYNKKMREEKNCWTDLQRVVYPLRDDINEIVHFS